MMQSTLAIEEPPSTPKGKVVPITTGIQVGNDNDQEEDMEKGQHQDTAASLSPPTTTKRRRFLLVTSLLTLAAVVGVLAGVLTTTGNARTLTPDDASTQADDVTITGNSGGTTQGCDECNEDDHFCKYPEGSCGETDDSGECHQRPEVCTFQYDPVCGCNGQTYGNACGAATGGISIRYTGECDASTGDSLSTSSQSSSCDSDSDCDGTEFCLFPPGDCGDSSGGECTLKPNDCGTGYDPVCGCNDRTYNNECFASSLGVSLVAGGVCPDPDRSAGECSNDDDCVEEGSFCMFEEGSCGTNGADVGECTVKPQVCTADWRPVCGCNGKTYGNACGAAGDGMSIAAQGECDTTCSDENDCLKEGHFCLFEQGICGTDAGNCESRPDACPRIEDPVCGCDGVTYYNECEARKEGGVSVASVGECPD